MSITPSVAVDTVKISSMPISMGNTLYVGGSGEGNYTKIQDAIDDASDGDTIFVYPDTYYENIVIDKSINLVGKDRYTTVIDGNKQGLVIYIKSDFVTISCFTIQNSGDNKGGDAGVKLESDFIDISFCDICHNENGIYAHLSNNNNITKCDLYENDYCGILFQHCSRNNISNCNVYANNFHGIYFSAYCYRNRILNCCVYNHIHNAGIFLYLTKTWHHADNLILNCIVKRRDVNGLLKLSHFRSSNLSHPLLDFENHSYPPFLLFL